MLKKSKLAEKLPSKLWLSLNPSCTLFAPPEFCTSIVFSIYWDGCNTQEKWKTKVIQKFGGGRGGQIRYIMGDV